MGKLEWDFFFGMEEVLITNVGFTKKKTFIGYVFLNYLLNTEVAMRLTSLSFQAI